jgi:hypothetical protein
MTTQTPMAFLLVKFDGSNSEPMAKAEADQMFTAAGRGTMNVVDWFDDNTHGQVDMADNEVFGWLTLPQKLSDYKGSGANPERRLDIINWAKQAAADAEINLSKFTAVVVLTNVEVDLFGTLGGVCCTAATTGKQFWERQAAPSVLCQEMIHGLGIYNHTRRHGSTADYNDPYDVMSMFNAWPGRNPSNPDIPVGPGLNAAFMKRCGWLDTSREAPMGQIMLRPLHRRDLSGPLYSQVGKYYVEYRPSSQWDTGFSSVVLVHYIAHDTSYLVAELRAGSEFKWGDPLIIFEEHGSIRVDDIDDKSETATITTAYSPAPRIPVDGPAWSIFGGELVDAGGLVVVGGRIVKVPPRSPELKLLEAVAALVNTNDLEIAPALKTAVRANIYDQVSVEIYEAHKHLTQPSSPFDHMTVEETHRFHVRHADT